MNKNNIAIANLTAYSEVFLNAVKFFQGADVKFASKTDARSYGLAIVLDDTLSRPVIINPFTLAMSRDGLARFYTALTKGERIGGEHRIQQLLKTINEVIRDGYQKGCSISFNIETGKYRFGAMKVISIMDTILTNALEYSMGKKEIKHLGDLYTLLGGNNGVYYFFKEVLEATEASIPDIEDTETTPTKYLQKIKCRTCRYCKCDEYGEYICTKVSTVISAERYGSDPLRYYDAHHSNRCEGLVSAIIDDRIDECNKYRMRKR